VALSSNRVEAILNQLRSLSSAATDCGIMTPKTVSTRVAIW
jgi:hypothetical protein